MFKKTIMILKDFLSIRHFVKILIELKDMILIQLWSEKRIKSQNPLNKFERKVFSQTGEDGITLEIIRRLGLEKKGVFAEFGVGDGLENNTIVLSALGWKGFWVGGESLVIDENINHSKFRFYKEWVSCKNILSILKKSLSDLGEENLNVISIDLDGNDIYFVENLLENKINPDLFIVEYNAKFIPPIQFKIEYNENHVWVGDDYFGASLTSFCMLFERYNYKLICCNSFTGANAFFIKSCHNELFNDIPNDINKIYAEPNYFILNKYGHKLSKKTIETIIKNN